jgi:hypothetical protein
MKRTPTPARTTPMKRTRLASGTPPKARRGKPKRFAARRDPAYCAWIRTLPCAFADNVFHACAGRVECCHVVSRGAGGDDRGNTFPACTHAHRLQHSIGIASFETLYWVDLGALAKSLELQPDAPAVLRATHQETE